MGSRFAVWQAAGHSASWAVAKTGELFTWGWEKFGRLGHSDTAVHLAPWRIEILESEWAVAISTGYSHTVAVTCGGSVFGWGDNEAFGLPSNDHGFENVRGVKYGSHSHITPHPLGARSYPNI